MLDLGKRNVLGVGVDAIDYEGAVERIVEAAKRPCPFAASALAVHGVMTGALDAEHRFRLNTLDLVAPDGQPVRWALRWLHGVRLPDRVYGPSLMLDVCRAAAEHGLPLFLFGGTEEMLEALRARLVAEFPGLRVAGVRASRFRTLEEQELQDLVDEIKDSGAAITVIGLGCPRQEVSAYELRDRLQTPVIAVGAAFAFHAGQLAQAPPILQRNGLEWLFRLLAEPRRLWRRYVLLNPLYLCLVALQLTRLRTVDLDDATRPTREFRYG